MAEEIHPPPSHASMLAVPSNPWALRPTALKVRRSRRPSGLGRAAGQPGRASRKYLWGTSKAVPRPTSPALMLMIRAVVFVPERHCRDTATRFARSHRPASFRGLGRGCGEVVNKSVVCLRRDSRRRRDTCPFPHYHSSPWPWTRRSRRSSPHSQKIGQVVYQRKEG